MLLSACPLFFKSYFYTIGIFALLLFYQDCHAQKSNEYVIISGYVREVQSLESLPGVRLFYTNSTGIAITNVHGYFSLIIHKTDSITLNVSCAGYKQLSLKISTSNLKELLIEMEPELELMQEIVVEGKQILESSKVQMSTIIIPIAQMKDLPGLLGEKDMLKVLQLMPGVQKGREGNSGLYVRGGGPDQNLVLLDGATIYNAFHLFGFYSLFNGDALKSVELTKGGFPARYGGRLSSVVEVTMKDGNKNKLHGEAGIGIISSKLTLEGPMFKNKASFLISARRTYLDLLVKPFLPKDRNAGYYFFDLNGKFNYDFGTKNKLFISSYWGGDKFQAKDHDPSDSTTWNGKIQWGNATATARWTHLFSNKIFSNTSIIFSNFKMSGSEINLGNDYRTEGTFSSSIRDFTLKSDVEFHASQKHALKAGLLIVKHAFNPVATTYLNTFNGNDNGSTGNKTNSLETGIYLEDTFKPFAWLSSNAGIRASAYLQNKKMYINPEPRVSIATHLSDRFSIKGSYSIMNQYLHLLSYTKVGLPADLWVPATRNVPPQRSQQLAIGIAKDFPQQNLYFTIETYYKKSQNVIAYKSGANYLNLDNDANQNWESKVTSGQGWSYGAEFLLHRKAGKLSGWLGYTLSWARVQFAELNEGKKFYSPYDRRNDASVVLIYKPSPRITISSTWVYGSGNRITLPINTYPKPAVSGSEVLETLSSFTDKNGYKMPAYHRLDFGIQFHKYFKTGMERTWEINIYNSYNRQNPYFYFIVTSGEEEKKKRKLKEIILFPILPSVSYKIKF